VVQRAAIAVVVALLVAAVALLVESNYITDPDLRYPIVLLTKIVGVISVIILAARVAIAFVKKRMSPNGAAVHEGLRNLGSILFLTIASTLGCVFGVWQLRGHSGAIELWPLVIVLVFGGLAAFGMRYLWREWQLYRRLSAKR
jgi:hypothetical protein